MTCMVRLHHSTILSALGPDQALTILFLGTHTRTSQWVTHPGIALAQTRLTSKFRWNPKWEYTYKAYSIHSPGQCGMLQSTPFRGPTSSSTHIRLGIGFDTKLSHPGLGPHHIPGSTLHSHENFLVGHSSWDCSHTNLLNFGVLMEPEANELPKGLVLGRDENIHIKFTGSTPLGNMGC
ncbi:unnamed protein product [Malus baccata var. baccata]